MKRKAKYTSWLHIVHHMHMLHAHVPSRAKCIYLDVEIAFHVCTNSILYTVIYTYILVLQAHTFGLRISSCKKTVSVILSAVGIVLLHNVIVFYTAAYYAQGSQVLSFTFFESPE